ncbi:hypothetical protein HMF7854_01135 [Sphingomonas ginkgonis]|uniref:Uncharacterized protein n=1 Tax=Sphingomonas ginkgonis TaxID=2315330 RepID=A0A3R9YKH1_9SPHN|nr:hypothetical protein HMF7854_01135 [Sphingomonas ginkgonis]
MTSCSTRGVDGAIVVCGRRSDRFRLPPELRSQPGAAAEIRPRLAFGAGDFAPCGLFRGERRCGKREAAQYGYGAGHDPITLVLKAVRALSGADH